MTFQIFTPRGQVLLDPFDQTQIAHQILHLNKLCSWVFFGAMLPLSAVTLTLWDAFHGLNPWIPFLSVMGLTFTLVAGALQIAKWVGDIDDLEPFMLDLESHPNDAIKVYEIIKTDPVALAYVEKAVIKGNKLSVGDGQRILDWHNGGREAYRLHQEAKLACKAMASLGESGPINSHPQGAFPAVAT